MPKLVGFSRFAELPEEQIAEKISRRILSGDQGMVVWWSIGAGVHVDPHSRANEQMVWMLKGKIPGGAEREAPRNNAQARPSGGDRTPGRQSRRARSAAAHQGNSSERRQQPPRRRQGAERPRYTDSSRQRVDRSAGEQRPRALSRHIHAAMGEAEINSSASSGGAGARPCRARSRRSKSARTRAGVTSGDRLRTNLTTSAKGRSISS